MITIKDQTNTNHMVLFLARRSMLDPWRGLHARQDGTIEYCEACGTRCVYFGENSPPLCDGCLGEWELWYE